MTETKRKKRIFISACEPSADVHCARLIEALNSLVGRTKGSEESIEWVGVGGERMKAAGCELMENRRPGRHAHHAFGQVGFCTVCSNGSGRTWRRTRLTW